MRKYVLALAAVSIFSLLANAAGAAKSECEKKAMTIVDVAAANKDFSTLVTALKAAGLVEELKKPGPFTVFAPTNDAFAKIPKKDLDALLKPENKEKLKSVLLYHVISGKVKAADVMKMKSPSMVASLQGEKIKVSHSDAGVMVNQAKVIKADVRASNGVIHVIDQVIMPPNK